MEWLASVAAGILASLAGVGLLVLYARYPTTTSRLFLIHDPQRDDDTSRQRYNYSPGPLKIDTVRLCSQTRGVVSSLLSPVGRYSLDCLPNYNSKCMLSCKCNPGL